ncbi:MAG: MFS transporter [Cucumibacter sp.]
MTATVSERLDPAGVRRARIAVSADFLLFGMCLALWYVHIPLVVARLELEPAVLGLLLIGPGIAGLIAQPLAGLLISRIGSRRVAVIAVPVSFVAMLLPIAAPSLATLALLLICAGALNNIADIALNMQATEIEKARGQPTMSSIHGFFSLGGLAGAALGGYVISRDWGDGSGAAMIGIAIVVAGTWSTRLLLDTPPPPRAAVRRRLSLALPALALLFFFIVTFLGSVVEGAVGDWSALFLDQVKNSGAALAASGYAVYSLAMAACRFAGGPVVEKLGDRRVIGLGGVLIALGMAIVILAPTPLASASGFLVIAIGAANIAPVMISVASRIPGVAPSAGVVVVSSAMIVGFLLGPPVIGFISQAWGLSVGLGVVGCLGLLVAAGARDCHCHHHVATDAPHSLSHWPIHAGPRPSSGRRDVEEARPGSYVFQMTSILHGAYAAARRTPILKDAAYAALNVVARLKFEAEVRARYSSPGPPVTSVETDPVPSLDTPISQLCTVNQFREHTYQHWAAEMRSPVRLNRKQWEFVYILQTLQRHGVLAVGRRGLGFGCGREPIAAMIAKRGAEVLATDLGLGEAVEKGWAAGHQHAADLKSLNAIGICPEDDFSRLASFEPCDMNNIPTRYSGLFDFTWSACSLEHLGSLRHGMDFVINAMRCLKPGGLAVHTTEFNLSSNEKTFETPHCSLYRRQDIERLRDELVVLGHQVAPITLNAGSEPVDRHVDMPPYKSSPHLRLEIGTFASTSIGIVVRKAS